MNEKELFHELIRRACATKPSNQPIEPQQAEDDGTTHQPCDDCSDTQTHPHSVEGT